MAAKKREIYARAAVQLRGHERPVIAERECPGAMGLYLFLLLHARGEETWGDVAELIAFASWGAPIAYRKKQAEALIVAGLVVRKDDGRLHVVKYEEHNDTPDTIEENRKGARLRKREERERERSGAQSHVAVTRDSTVTPPPVTRDMAVTSGVTDASVTISPLLDPSLGSSSGSDPDLPVRLPTPIRVGTTAAHRAREVFEDAVAAATGGTFALTTAPFHDRDLCLLLNKHGPKGKPIADVLAWLGDTVQAWVPVTPDDDDDRKPSKLNDWLNGGRRDRRKRAGPRAVAVQSMEGACFKIPEGF